MITIIDFSRTIHGMVVNKQFADALDYFKQHKNEVDNQQISSNEFLVADMLSALRGIKAYDAALQFLQIYNISIDTKTTVRVLNSYGWVLYFQYKTKQNVSSAPANVVNFDAELPESERTNNTDLQFDNHENRIEKLMGLLVNSNDSYSTNLAEYLFKLIMHTQKAQATTNWKLVERICKHTDPMKLSTTCANIQVERKGLSKEMELASAREEWYAMYSKALYEAGSYKQCAEICQQALQVIDKMHYSNEIWFERRQAQCFAKTKEYKAAILIYEQIITRKHYWFMLKELCECYYAMGNSDKAMRYGRKAASAYGPINFKVELIELLGDMLLKQNDKALAYKHFQLAKIIREAEKWKVGKALTEKIAACASDSAHISENKEKLKSELIDFWNDKATSKQITTSNTNQEPSEITIGKITKLLASKETGMDGFVQSDKGKSAYFFVPTNTPLFSQLKVGLQVQYQVKPALKGDKAVNIAIIK